MPLGAVKGGAVLSRRQGLGCSHQTKTAWPCLLRSLSYGCPVAPPHHPGCSRGLQQHRPPPPCPAQQWGQVKLCFKRKKTFLCSSRSWVRRLQGTCRNWWSDGRNSPARMKGGRKYLCGLDKPRLKAGGYSMGKNLFFFPVPPPYAERQTHGEMQSWWLQLLPKCFSA